MSEVLEESVLPVPVPERNPDTERFWAAADDGEFLIRRCHSCGEAIWYPRPICPSCHSTDTDWEAGSGRGTIYSFSVVRRAGGKWRDVTPYVVAYIELEEGPRVMSNVVDCDVDSIEIGDAVEVAFFDTGGGSALPRFRPAPDSAAHT